MSNLSIKKISAAAVAAVLGFSAFSQAGVIVANTSDFTGATQIDTGSRAMLSSGGLLTIPGDGATSIDYSDFVPTGASGINLNAYNGGTPGGGGGQDVTISFDMNTTIAPASNGYTSGAAGAPYVGVNVYDNNNGGTNIAELLSEYGTGQTVPAMQTTVDGTPVVPGINTSPDTTTGTYTITLDPTNNTYFASYGGQTYTGVLYANGEPTGTNDIEVSLASVDQGLAGSTQFSNFSITSSVPEPASMAMIGVGGLLLLAKRPKRLA